MIRPRPYLSWTQLTTLETSEAQYRKCYIEGRKLFENEGIVFGKMVADALEANAATGEAMVDVALAQIPKFELMDHPFETTVTVGSENIPLLSKIDTARRDLSGFKEYKTGTTKWDQRKVDEFGQITFYATVIYQLTGKIPHDIELVWLPTERVEQASDFGSDRRTQFRAGEMRVFRTRRTLADIIKMKIRMRNAWVRIAEITEGEIF